MPTSDIPLQELRTFTGELDEPADFDDFWRDTLASARQEDSLLDIHEVQTPVKSLIIEDLTFRGFSGDPVRAWVTRPPSDGPLPVVVEYLGYGGGRGLPGERLGWASSGYLHILMDTRGQGSAWGTGGDTPDPHGTGPAFPGVMTRGIERPESYYYRRLMTDAVRIIDSVTSLPAADPDRIGVVGGSQGGALAIAAAALHPAVKTLCPEVPFLCSMRRSVELTPDAPFTEVSNYLGVHRDRVDETFSTLSYFDGANFASRIHQPALFSTALMDTVVLPSTVFAAYNRLSSVDKEIVVYEFNGHEGGQHRHWERQASWLSTRL